MTRLSVDQKQVLVQRHAEDERQRLESALSRDSQLSSDDVDAVDDAQPPPTAYSTKAEEKDLAVTSPPAEAPDHGRCSAHDAGPRYSHCFRVGLGSLFWTRTRPDPQYIYPDPIRPDPVNFPTFRPVTRRDPDLF